MKISFFVAAAVLSLMLVSSLPLVRRYSTRQEQQDFLQEHGYYVDCVHDNAIYVRVIDTLVSMETKENRSFFEGDQILKVKLLEKAEENLTEPQPVDPNEAQFWKAVWCFQRKSGLPQTGIVNEKTRKEMENQGNASQHRKKRFATEAKWKKSNVTYYIKNYDIDLKRLSLTEQVVRSEIQQAIKLWTDVSGLRVTEWNSTEADIVIGFYSGDHGDGFPFNGPKGSLAHTFGPGGRGLDGDIHLDASETWTAFSQTGTNLRYVVAHEFGHAIGILHSNVRESIMAPEDRPYDPKLKLDDDDINAVQSLYGKRLA